MADDPRKILEEKAGALRSAVEGLVREFEADTGLVPRIEVQAVSDDRFGCSHEEIFMGVRTSLAIEA